jgi:hypothetical protein
MKRLSLVATVAAAAIIASLGVGGSTAHAAGIDDVDDRAIALNALIQSGQVSPDSLSKAQVALLTRFAKPAHERRSVKTTDIALSDPSVQDALAEIRAEEGPRAALTTTCKQQRGQRIAYGLIGNKLYMSWHIGAWCYTSSGTVSIVTVTSARRVDSGGATYWFGWENHGVVGSGAGVVRNSGRSYSQHSFKNPLAYQQVQPCVRVKGAVTASVDFVCGIN